jgi:hypothetical protein
MSRLRFIAQGMNHQAKAPAPIVANRKLPASEPTSLAQAAATSGI